MKKIKISLNRYIDKNTKYALNFHTETPEQIQSVPFKNTKLVMSRNGKKLYIGLINTETLKPIYELRDKEVEDTLGNNVSVIPNYGTFRASENNGFHREMYEWAVQDGLIRNPDEGENTPF